MQDKSSIKDIVILIVCVSVVVIGLIGISYSHFISINKGQDNIINIGDLNVSFCIDETCKKDYANFGQVIGTKNVNGESNPDKIYPYENDIDALNNMPYVFNIKNTGSLKTYVTIKLVEDKDYVPSNKDNFSTAQLYSDHIKIGISECNGKINRENVNIRTYGELVDNTLVYEDVFESNTDKTYCLWTWLDNSTPNEVQNTYFVANLEFKAEYRPK